MNNLKCIVCGMNVNEKNYKVNQFAFLNGNKDLDIKYCPFCGASSIYLSDSEEIFPLGNLTLDDETIKILDHASKLETFNHDFYLEASKLAKNEKVRHAFKDLAQIELMHAKIHMKMAGIKEMPNLSKLEYSHLKDNDEELLAAAEKREEHAVKYYEKYLPLVKGEVVRKVFKVLSSIEQEHITLTNCLI